MTFKDLAQKRFSTRAYTTQSVEKEKMDYIFECIRFAPSAVNYQPWHFYVIANEPDKIAVQKSYNREWFKKAPIYIIACGNCEEAWKRSNFDNKNHMEIDLAIAGEHLCLAASDIDLGSCWVCNFDPLIIKDLLNLPDHITPVAIFPIGYPDKTVEAPIKKRKDVQDIVTWR